MGMLHKIVSAVATVAALAVSVSLAAAATVSRDNIHPALWLAEKDGGKVYIFGSYHILKKGVIWVTPALVSAMEKSDAFVFEVPVGAESMPDAQAFIDSRGYLPEGQTLRAQLSPEALQHYQQLLAGLPLKPREMDKLRPWLAQLTLSSSFYGERKFSVINGADIRILSYALTHKKPVSYLETPRQQLEFFFESAQTTELENFEALVNTFDRRPASIDAAIKAWIDGDVDELSMRLHRGLASNPKGKKILLDDRNLSWAEQISRMLAESKTTFVTVGIGHLGGPQSVIEVLCKRGVKVTRLATANEHVDTACPAASLSSS
jgi:uncharacterized protein YbaP (TraB family)